MTSASSTLPSFAELGLPEKLVSALERRGISTPFPIQAACLPDTLAGRDVLGRGQTGSGKTLAFGLPLLARLAGRSAAPKRPAALILVPTRELAAQVQDALAALGRSVGLHAKTVVGGMSMTKQIQALRRGVDLLVATPGRLTDLIERGACSLEDVQITVLDEADHMCDLGFMPAVSALLDQIPSNGQRMLFSATLDGDVDKLVRRYLHDPVTHSVSPAAAPVETMDHHLFVVDRAQKHDVIAEVAGREGRTIMFVRTKHGVDALTKRLARVGVRAGALHGGKTQSARTRTLADFREGKVAVLIATDVAARGIHVDDVTLVVHVDPAADHKDYLHRAGRTARAGERGTVATLVAHNEVRNAERMMRRAGVRALRSRVTVGDDTLIRITGAQAPSGIPVEVEPEPRPQRRGHRPGAGRDRRPGGQRGERYGERREGGRARFGERHEGRPGEGHDGTPRQRPEGRSGGPRHDDRPNRRPEGRRPRRETAQ
ncbi:DEAD/DEAH box helicase [Actinomadura sp. DC4]|uniref:DEAD/DEAH box helicase n=1 Tax=Actinomadura sp. DC4 TaxID=3055069 RepID=UPI0025B1D3B9|nr:DEAD/DEAH box helicase [Actinomadura sp. DC4]MDN3352730.1 DEAD/DEAH box helicase [Actinomadura sp. DC4]